MDDAEDRLRNCALCCIGDDVGDVETSAVTSMESTAIIAAMDSSGITRVIMVDVDIVAVDDDDDDGYDCRYTVVPRTILPISASLGQKMMTMTTMMLMLCSRLMLLPLLLCT